MDFSTQIIEWYRTNKRDLPWRKTKNPYQIWLSEIILQQTRVEQGLSYYLKFIEKYPSIKDLANAPQDEVLKLWQGLGYYSRARNLHYTSKVITDKYKGEFPATYKEILDLKGIGEYTAAAISSFSFNLPYPVIDGNVYRVLSRVFDIDTPIDSTLGKKEFKELAYELINKNNPSEYNQAIMEFGALYCKPQSPDCENCIFTSTCLAFKTKKINELPVKSKKLKQKNRYFNYLVFIDEDYTYLKKRTHKDIWHGLFDFPLIETPKKIDNILNNQQEGYSFLFKNHLSIKKSEEQIHILSHQKIHATFWTVKQKNLTTPTNGLIKVDLKDINNYPVPKLIENYLSQNLKNCTFDI
ncbi:MAG: A/G-specific adenine glycosylase [Flavobacteriales bacterium]|nr:A/G-specific adenine glycosylase [Flavobacteriales bacterium]MCB9334597.1 A/G-specific adenine glycosylase [Flavobacteriales bacterium]